MFMAWSYRTLTQKINSIFKLKAATFKQKNGWLNFRVQTFCCRCQRSEECIKGESAGNQGFRGKEKAFGGPLLNPLQGDGCSTSHLSWKRRLHEEDGGKRSWSLQSQSLEGLHCKPSSVGFCSLSTF